MKNKIINFHDFITVKGVRNIKNGGKLKILGNECEVEFHRLNELAQHADEF